MKIVGVSCSPRKGKTTRASLERCMSAITSDYPEIQTEIIDLAGLDIRGCIACGHCMKELECSQKDDFNDLIPILKDPDVGGLILATPVYLGTITSQCKAFLDRTVMFRRNGFLFRNIVGGALAVGGFRNGGQEASVLQIHSAMLVHDMILVGDGKPGAHFGGTMWSGHPEGMDKDEPGFATVSSLGQRVAQVALKIHG
ncbi:putative Iron-sulfur flavoprotein [delta proteobacterium NaphS2]|nr:putative Iron-sulfur flavoprotein [delta proteobacterium NaphS2]